MSNLQSPKPFFAWLLYCRLTEGVSLRGSVAFGFRTHATEAIPVGKARLLRCDQGRRASQWQFPRQCNRHTALWRIPFSFYQQLDSPVTGCCRVASVAQPKPLPGQKRQK